MLFVAVYFTGLFLWILLGAYTVAPATDFAWWSAALWGFGYNVLALVVILMFDLL